MSRREIREALALPDSTVRRWLADLVELEYLEADGGGAREDHALPAQRPRGGESVVLGLRSPAELATAWTSQPRQTPQTALAGSKSLSHPAEERQPRSFARKASRPVCPRRMSVSSPSSKRTCTSAIARRTAEHYVADARAFLMWLGRHGLALKDVRGRGPAPLPGGALRAAQARRAAARRRVDRAPARSRCETLFRFLARRGYLLFDPSGVLELPRVEKRLPRVILTEAEARRIVTAPRGATRSRFATARCSRSLYATGLRVERADPPPARGRGHRRPAAPDRDAARAARTATSLSTTAAAQAHRGLPRSSRGRSSCGRAGAGVGAALPPRSAAPR